MIEKMKAISNPLTIIAIFAAEAEILGTISLANVDKELQHVFIWFVMLFPVFLMRRAVGKSGSRSAPLKYHVMPYTNRKNT